MRIIAVAGLSTGEVGRTLQLGWDEFEVLRVVEGLQFVIRTWSQRQPVRRRQPTRLPYPWDSPGKNTGVGCHFLLQCMKVKSESEDAQSCPTLHDPKD